MVSQRYIKAEDRIAAFQKFGWKLGLDRMRSLCDSLGNPQDSLRVIHVAGTNGKGSVCRYLYEVLLAHGYSVGMFTSPGLGDFRSRIESNGEWISAPDLERCTDIVLGKISSCAEDPPTRVRGTRVRGTPVPQRVYNVSHKSPGSPGESVISDTPEPAAEDPPTEFEVLTAIAFVYFASKQLDFTILEVGLGGSLDSTNIIGKSAVSVITEIGLDHTEQLGDTIEKIAAEKAGIVKAGCPVVCGTSDKRAAEVIARKAYEIGAPLIDSRSRVAGEPLIDSRSRVAGEPLIDSRSLVAGEPPGSAETCTKDKGYGSISDRNSYKILVKAHRQDITGSAFSCEIRGTRYTNIEISMPGEHQIKNAVTALAAFDELRRSKLIRAGGSVPMGEKLVNAGGSAPMGEKLVSADGAAPMGEKLFGTDGTSPMSEKLIYSDGDALRRGMKAARLPGRFEVHAVDTAHPDHTCKLIIFDGAHNPDGATALADTVTKLLPHKHIIILTAMMRDKQTDGILKEIKRFASFAVFTETSNDRCMSATELSGRWNTPHEKDESVADWTMETSDVALDLPGMGSGSPHAAHGLQNTIPDSQNVALELSDAIPNLQSAYAHSIDLLKNGKQMETGDTMKFDALVVCGSLYLISDLMEARANDMPPPGPSTK